MNILAVPDSFKGSLTALEFCEILEKTLKIINKNYNVIKCPMADGGEGTVDSVVSVTNGEFIFKEVRGPLGDKVNSKYGILGNKQTAIIEMAEASGLTLIPKNMLNPFKTSTYGTGELIKDAIDRGCKNIIIGIGGSATNDGGVGMAKVFGYRFLDLKDKEIKDGAEGLLSLNRIDASNFYERVNNVDIEVACDVINPLYGENGASFVYAIQKGAKENELQILDNSLKNLDYIIRRDLGINISNLPGAGAAGGLGAGLVAFLGGELKPGFALISDAIGLTKILDENTIDLIVTGEGQIDHQSVMGKLPGEIAKIAHSRNIPVIAICGSKGKDWEYALDKGIKEVFTLSKDDMTIEYCMINVKKLLEEKIYEIFS